MNSNLSEKMLNFPVAGRFYSDETSTPAAGIRMPVVKRWWITVATGLALLGNYGTANAFCFSDAAIRYQVNEYVLRAIAQHESRMNPSIALRNANGSLDLGLMGINTIHLEPGEPLYRGGFTAEMLLDPCTNVMTGAYLLRLKMNRFGNTWQAVGAYHSKKDTHNARYQRLIWESLQAVLKQSGKSVLANGGIQ